MITDEMVRDALLAFQSGDMDWSSQDEELMRFALEEAFSALPLARLLKAARPYIEDRLHRPDGEIDGSTARLLNSVDAALSAALSVEQPTPQQHLVAVPRDRLLKLLEYSDAEYVPNSLFSEFRTYLDNPAPQTHVNGSDDAKAKLELWFFRDMFESNRLALFSLFGFKPADMDTMAKQRLVFCSILDALATEGKV